MLSARLPCTGNLLATRSGDLVYLDFGMMSEAPEYARYAIMAHVVHLVNRCVRQQGTTVRLRDSSAVLANNIGSTRPCASCKDYHRLQFIWDRNK